jgi:hypothetical protein
MPQARFRIAEARFRGDSLRRRPGQATRESRRGEKLFSSPHWSVLTNKLYFFLLTYISLFALSTRYFSRFEERAHYWFARLSRARWLVRV